jgi:2-phosphosulfolactate phosphatase
MKPSVIIDCLPQSVNRYRSGYAIVSIDVIRATTMAITAVAQGRRCFVADSIDAVHRIASGLNDPLVAGELAGDIPDGFDMNNSPADLASRTDIERPLVLLSSSGTKLICEASRCKEPAYLACFRNYAAVTRHLIGRHCRVAVIGAGSRGEFREEDQMCCAWIAEELVKAGYTADKTTRETIDRWSGAPPSACSISHSVDYLRRTGQLRDLDFILEHVNDLDAAYVVRGSEVAMAEVGSAWESLTAA